MLKRAHVVQPVGELDDYYANVGHHRQQHLADVLRLVLFAVGELDLVELGDAFDDVRDLVAKALGYFWACDIRVLHCIMQQPRGNRGGIHLHLGQHLRDFQRMNDVRLARGALLAVMLLHGEVPRAADQVEIVIGPVGMHCCQHVVEALCQRRRMRQRRNRRSFKRGLRSGRYQLARRLIQCDAAPRWQRRGGSQRFWSDVRQGRFHLQASITFGGFRNLQAGSGQRTGFHSGPARS